MRVGTDPALQEFTHHLENLGNGTLPVKEDPDWIEVPQGNNLLIDDTTEQTVTAAVDMFVK